MLRKPNLFIKGFSKLASPSGSCLFRRSQARGGDDLDFYQRLQRAGQQAAAFGADHFCETTQPGSAGAGEPEGALQGPDGDRSLGDRTGQNPAIHFYREDLHNNAILRQESFQCFRELDKLPRSKSRQNGSELLASMPDRLNQLRKLARQLDIATLPD